MTMIKALNLVGRPRERGYHHGRTLQDRIHNLYERFIRMMESVPQGQGSSADPFSESALMAFAGEHGQPRRTMHPISMPRSKASRMAPGCL